MYEVTSGVFDFHTTWANFNAIYTLGSTYLAKNTVLNASNPDPVTGLPAAAGWYKFDITTLVNRAAATSGTDKKIRLCLKAVTGNLAVRFYSVNVLTNTDWNYVSEFAPFLDVQSPAGINNVTNTNVATVYKNANNQIAIDCKGDLRSDASVSVYNVTGQELTTRSITTAKTVLIKTFASGVYVIKVTNGGANTTQKLILN